MIAAWFADPTRATGQFAFAVAAGAAVTAAWSGGRRPDRTLWWAIALVFVALWIETVAGWRFVPRALAQAWLEARGAYGSRTGLQTALLVGLGVAAAAAVAVALAVAWRRRRSAVPRTRTATRVALAATAALVALVAVEAVSLHAVDVRLYARVGPLLAIGWLWVAGAAVVVGMAAAHSRGR